MEMNMNKKRLITSALPYVNNVPHLGNLIQVLSADVFARYCRSNGYDTLYVCGTDEYGTATETKALSEGVTPKELCDQYYKVHADIYQWFNISFDTFGRTSTPQQTEIVQSLFNQLNSAGYIFEKEITQLYSEQSKMFLADRYVQGTCPKCHYNSARGDQCEKCGTLLDPLDLINPVSAIDNTVPIPKNTKHLYIDLPKMEDILKKWIAQARDNKRWSNNAVKISEAWLRDGLHARAITRDLKWGIPVPQEGYEHKVFYVWFDAPIGYISITATHTKDWESWWKNPDEVLLYQFIGKDNIPFHTVVFPATLLGGGDTWTMLHKISSSEYLNYEDGMFSKSKGIGVFGNDVIDTGIPADVWRFYIMYNRPESSDYLFTWKDFQETVNSELINNLSNLYKRTISCISKYCDTQVQAVALKESDTRAIWDAVITLEEEITTAFEHVELRKAYLKIFRLSDYANKLLQDYEPWKLVKEDLPKTSWLLSNLVYIIRDIIAMIEPYTPDMARRMAETLNIDIPTWKDLVLYNQEETLNSITSVNMPEMLFTRLENKQIEAFRERFSGSQSDRLSKESAAAQAKSTEPPKEDTSPTQFAQKVCLKVAKVREVTPHPNADKLYILHLDDGSEEGRTIVSGIRDYYSVEDLTGKSIIVVANLKPAKLRGVLSNGMLLAASAKSATDNTAKELVEVLLVEGAPPGTLVLPQGESSPQEHATLTVDTFFSFSLSTDQDKKVLVDSTPLVIDADTPSQEIYADTLANAKVG